MSQSNRTPVKTGGRARARGRTHRGETGAADEDSELIILADGREIECRDYYVSEREAFVGIYIDAKSGGIDLRIPMRRIEAIVSSEAGRQVMLDAR